MALVRPVRGSLGRTDMGVDIGVTPGDPVVAIAPSRMIGIIRDWFQGQPLGWFQILSGPYSGKYWYAAEQIDFSARPGQTFAAGQRIGTIARHGTNTEFGWATHSGATLAAATTGYREGQVTPAGKSFRAALMGATAPGDFAWHPCTLTWYDPALGGTNSSSGRSEPHGATASGKPYNPSAFTCAAPSRFPFGHKLTFKYRGRMVTCTVTDRGGAITGDHFDLSRIAAERLGIINAGRVSAQYSEVGAGQTPPSGGGVVRPGGTSDEGQGLENLYKAFLDEGKQGDTSFADFVTTPGAKGKIATQTIGFSLPFPGGSLNLPFNLPNFDPFNLFSEGTHAIQSTIDLLKLIGWILNPRNILRVVEFLVGLSLLYIAIRIELRVFGDAASERSGRGKRGGRGKGGRGSRGRPGRTGRSGSSGRRVRSSSGTGPRPKQIEPAPSSAAKAKASAGSKAKTLVTVIPK